MTRSATFEKDARGKSVIRYEGKIIEIPDGKDAGITGTASAVHAVDWDGDGRIDLLIGDIRGRVYLVPRRMMDDLRSLVAGQRIDTPDDLAKKIQENTPKGDTTSWWLKQALDAGGTPSGDRP